MVSTVSLSSASLPEPSPKRSSFGLNICGFVRSLFWGNAALTPTKFASQTAERTLASVLTGEITATKRSIASDLIKSGARVDEVLDTLVEVYNKKPSSTLIAAARLSHGKMLMHALARRSYETVLAMLYDPNLFLTPQEKTAIFEYFLKDVNFTDKSRYVDALFLRGAKITDEIRHNLCVQGLLPGIFLRYSRDMAANGDQSLYVDAIRSAHPELESDLWKHSDYHLDAEGFPVTYSDTSREYLLTAVQRNNENVLRAYQRITHRFYGIEVLEHALATGKFDAARWLVKANAKISGMPKLCNLKKEGDTPLTRLFSAIQEEDIHYLSKHKNRVVSFELEAEQRKVSPVECALHFKKYVSCVCLIEHDYPIPKKLSKEDAEKIIHFACLMGKIEIAKRVVKCCKELSLPQGEQEIARNLQRLINGAILEDDREFLQGVARSELYYPHQKWEDSPIHFALHQKKFYAVSLFLNFGIYPFPSELLKSPELYLAAAEHCHENTLRLLLNSSAPLPSSLIPTALEGGWDRALALILTHPSISHRISHPFHSIMGSSQTAYRTSLARAFQESGLDPLSSDGSGKNFVMILLEQGDHDLASEILIKLRGNVSSDQKKEIAKLVEEIVKAGSFPKISPEKKRDLIWSCLNLFDNQSVASRVIELCHFLNDFTIIPMLPQIIPNYDQKDTTSIVLGITAKLQTELGEFDKHMNALTLDPVLSVLETMMKMLRLADGMRDILTDDQWNAVNRFHPRVGICLEEANTMERLHRGLEQAQITNEKSDANLKKLVQWIANLPREDRALIRVTLRLLGAEPNAILEKLYHFLVDRSILSDLLDLLPGYESTKVDEFGKKIIGCLRQRSQEFHQIKDKSSQEKVLGLLEEMAKLYQFGKEMERHLSAGVSQEIQAAAFQAKLCLSEKQCSDCFTDLLKVYGITDKDTLENRKKMANLMQSLARKAIHSEMDDFIRGMVLERAVCYLDKDPLKGIFAFYPLCADTKCFAMLPCLAELGQKLDAPIAAEIQHCKDMVKIAEEKRKQAAIQRLAKILLFSLSLKRPISIPLPQAIYQDLAKFLEASIKLKLQSFEGDYTACVATQSKNALPRLVTHLEDMTHLLRLGTAISSFIAPETRQNLESIHAQIEPLFENVRKLHAE